MQLRLATREDIDAIAVVLAEAFREEELHAYIFPGRDRWPEDYVRCWRECVQERWWDYSKVWVVGIEDEVDGGQGDLKAECEDEGEKLSKIVGVAEWQRVGPGWERLWGCRGWWDPREYCLLFSSLCLRWRMGRKSLKLAASYYRRESLLMYRECHSTCSESTSSVAELESSQPIDKKAIFN